MAEVRHDTDPKSIPFPEGMKFRQFQGLAFVPALQNCAAPVSPMKLAKASLKSILLRVMNRSMRQFVNEQDGQLPDRES